MEKKLLFILAAAIVSAGTLFAGDSASNVTIQPRRTSPTDGKGMYSSYCAPCHGVDGRGNGPLASSLKRKPSNLAALSQNNGGTYPAAHVIGVMEHQSWVTDHKQTSMPDWGSVLGMMKQDNKLDVPLRIRNLSRYVETLQTK
jgi:Cytochrome c553